MKKTIIYITKSLADKSGASVSSLDTLLALATADIDLCVASMKRTALPDTINSHQVHQPKWVSLPRNAEFPLPGERFLYRLLRFLIFTPGDPVRKRILSAVKSDLVIANGYGTDPYVSDNEKYLHGKKLLIVRESPRHFSMERNEQNSLHSAVRNISQYDYLVFVSDTCRREWLDLIPVNADNTFHIPNCCNEEAIPAITELDRGTVRRRLQFPEKTYAALCVGSIIARKGQDILIDIMPSLVKEFPGFQLYMIGHYNTSWGRELVSRAKTHPCKDRIHFLGHRDNALEYMYAADLLLLPSRAEALPRVLLEAGLLRTPVIASDVDGNTEIVIDGETGFLFSPACPEKIIPLIRKLREDEELRRKLTDNAHARYWENFSREQLIRRYNDLLQGIFSR